MEATRMPPLAYFLHIQPFPFREKESRHLSCRFGIKVAAKTMFLRYKFGRLVRLLPPELSVTAFIVI